jgi:hypothetical protein
MYATMLYGEEPSAFSIYHSLRSNDIRKNVFLVTARENLPATLYDEVESFFQELREVAGKRNLAVHGTWAATDSRPDSLFLCEPKDIGQKLKPFLNFTEKVSLFLRSSLCPIGASSIKFVTLRIFVTESKRWFRRRLLYLGN